MLFFFACCAAIKKKSTSGPCGPFGAKKEGFWCALPNVKLIPWQIFLTEIPTVSTAFSVFMTCFGPLSISESGKSYGLLGPFATPTSFLFPSSHRARCLFEGEMGDTHPFNIHCSAQNNQTTSTKCQYKIPDSKPKW